MKKLQRYIYEGPVMEFDSVICRNWKSETLAQSEAKARSNFKYQFKKQNGKTSDSKIELVGEIMIV